MMRISFIGSGNMATSLALIFHKKDIEIFEVFSRDINNAKRLAEQVKATAVDQIRSLSPDADAYILAVADDAMPELAAMLHFGDKPVLHTSGSVDLKSISSISSRTGVLYPLQSVSKTRSVDLSDVPVFIEASDRSDLEFIRHLAHMISSKVIELDSLKRRELHLAAVMVNNFTNHIYQLANEYLKSRELKLDYLLPLIKESARRLEDDDPMNLQTGPARRGDRETIAKHLDMLKEEPGLHEVYELLSKQILEQFGHI